MPPLPAASGTPGSHAEPGPALDRPSSRSNHSPTPFIRARATGKLAPGSAPNSLDWCSSSPTGACQPFISLMAGAGDGRAKGPKTPHSPASASSQGNRGLASRGTRCLPLSNWGPLPTFLWPSPWNRAQPDGGDRGLAQEGQPHQAVAVLATAWGGILLHFPGTDRPQERPATGGRGRRLPGHYVTPGRSCRTGRYMIIKVGTMARRVV